MKKIINHLETLEKIAHYVSPNDGVIEPNLIPEGIELVELITAGEVFFEVDGEYKSFGKGTIFWHQAGEYTICRTNTKNPYQCAVFGFFVNDTNRPTPRVGFWDANSNQDRFISECFELFYSDKLSKETLSLYVYSTLLRHVTALHELSGQCNYPPPLERAITYINDNLGVKISVENLACSGNVSVPHIFKLFQKHLSTTPHRYILSQQLLQAKTMLAGTSLPIKAIALECGFENIEVFYRQFHRENAMPPGRYRREHLPYHFPQM